MILALISAGAIATFALAGELPAWPPGQGSRLPFELDNCPDETEFVAEPNNVVGYGVLDAYAAVKMARETGGH